MDPLLERVLRDPRSALALSDRHWDLLIRQARRAELLGHLAATLEDRGELGLLPPRPRAHLKSALALVRHQARAVLWEARQISAALAELSVPVVALKGMAYVLAGLPNARGRLFSDLDILVPEQALDSVEAALMLNGWSTLEHDPYDQRYYRQWMHEIPPMRHLKRGTVIDVHHAILPRTARIRVDSASMRAAAVPIPGFTNFFVFQPVDMVLHSATHLFHEGELDKGLRDLVDLDILLRHFGQNDKFWPALAARATEVGLTRPLHYALRYASRMLDTPVPAPLSSLAETWGPAAPLPPLMDALYARALRPNHPTASDRLTGVARWMLYVRAHWLRMPAHLLVYHLTRKALRREEDVPSASDRPVPPDKAGAANP